MKKVLSVMAVSAFVLTAGVALAGGPGKKMDAGCPEACQQQIDDLQSSQAQQNEQLGAHGKQLEDHERRITALEYDSMWYARLGVRAAWLTQDVAGVEDEWDSDAGFGGAVAFGRQLGDFRAEVEFAYQDADMDEFTDAFGDVYGGDVNVMTVMVNGYYELPVYDAFSVYAMAGIGYAKYDMDVDVNSVYAGGESDNAFAYKAGVGMTYNFTEEIAGDLGYEYLGVADAGAASSINGHNVVASVRFKF
jgi:opacity protein-like surface antigen